MVSLFWPYQWRKYVIRAEGELKLRWYSFIPFLLLLIWTIVLLINVQIYKADHIMVPWAYFDSPFPMRQIALFCVEISNLCLWKFLNFSVIHHSSVIHKHTQYERFISILMFRHVLCGTFTDMVYVKDSYIDSQGVNSQNTQFVTLTCILYCRRTESQFEHHTP